MEVIPTSQQDYLDQDQPIRGQKYCCLSFVSPEEVIRNKDIYFLQKFLHEFSGEMNTFMEQSLEAFKENHEIVNALTGVRERFSYIFDTTKLQDEYEYYKAANSADLENEYLEKNNFQTTIRGLKVRGSYESLKEAQIRAQVLKRMDDKFNVFVAEVGCWCPWSPNPAELENQEYAETHLNTLVKKYHENQTARDEFFLQRKNQMYDDALKENEENKKLFSITESMEDQDDPWMKHKKDEESPAEVPAAADDATANDTTANDAPTAADSADTVDDTVQTIVGDIITSVVSNADDNVDIKNVA